jgi:hypothetical protein
MSLSLPTNFQQPQNMFESLMGQHFEQDSSKFQTVVGQKYHQFRLLAIKLSMKDSQKLINCHISVSDL